MKLSENVPDEQAEQLDFPINIVTYSSIYLSVGITVSVILTGFKLGIGQTPIVNCRGGLLQRLHLFSLFLYSFFFLLRY